MIVRSFTGKLVVINALLLILGGLLSASCALAQGALAAASGESVATTPSRSGYRVTNKFTIGGDPGWDYIVVDPQARRVYVTHVSKIEVLNADTGKTIGQITEMNGARGIALVKSRGRGYATNGKSSSVSVIDLKTLKHVAELKAGTKPDAIIYDAGTDQVFVNNGDSDEMTVIDAKAGQVIATIPLGGGPEFLAADGKGTVWVNLFDKNAFATVDGKKLKLTKTTPIEGCKGPASMGFDSVNRRLFIGCHNHVLAVVDPDTGTVIQKLPLGEHPDAIIFDAARRLIFASTGDGVLTIVHQDTPNTYSVVDNVTTMRGAKTLGFDSKTGKLFSATVENVPLNATSQPAPLGKVVYDPGPFVVLEINK